MNGGELQQSEVWVQLMGGEGARARVILVLRQCIWNAAPWVILYMV